MIGDWLRENTAPEKTRWLDLLGVLLVALFLVYDNADWPPRRVRDWIVVGLFGALILLLMMQAIRKWRLAKQPD